MLLLTAAGASSAAGQISSLNASLSSNQITLNGSAAALSNNSVLQITDGGGDEYSSAWYNVPQSVGSGFTTVFQFRITPADGQADGIAFVLQNASNYGAGAQLSARSTGQGGDIGYGSADDSGTPIDNSLAIEFDTYQNGWDPDNDHIAVQSCGTGNNTPDHTATCPSGNPAKLGIASMPNSITLADGNVHTVIIQYDPGMLNIYIDNNGTPVLTVPVTLTTLLNLVAGQNAYVGFTGATGGSSEVADILSWTFTPGGAAATPTTISQMLSTGTNQTTNYVFGSYNHKYTYSNANAGDQVTVTAMPTVPAVVNAEIAFYSPSASCVTYDGTGGDCVVFYVACTAQTGTDCSALPYTLMESFNTNQTINNSCLLKTEVLNTPPTPTIWMNIQTNFTQTRTDPTSTGTSKGFSYFVVAQNCIAPQQAASLTGNNCAGVYTGTYNGNLTVSAGQSCTINNGGITGNLTQKGGTVTLENAAFVNGNFQTNGGNDSVSNSTIGNDFQISGSGTFSIGPGVSIGNNLQVQNMTSTVGMDQICGVTIKGNLQVQSVATPMQIGSNSGCAGNTIGNNLQVQSDSGALQIYSNQAKGNIQVQSNTGGTQVYNNTTASTLQCQQNTNITGGGNTAQQKQQQCATF